jgi:hypothetical protein
VVAKIRERLAVNKQKSQRFRMERFTLKKLNELRVESNIVLRYQIGWSIPAFQSYGLPLAARDRVKQ